MGMPAGSSSTLLLVTGFAKADNQQVVMRALQDSTSEKFNQRAEQEEVRAGTCYNPLRGRCQRSGSVSA